MPSRGLGVPPRTRVGVASVLVRVLVVLVWLAVSASSSCTLTFVLPLSTSFRLALARVVAFAFASTFARVFARILSTYKYSIKYQVPGPCGDCSASKGPVNPYQAHRVPAATVTATVAVAYTANIGATRRPRWSHRPKATKKIHQATPDFPRPQSGGESPRVLPWAHHVHIHDASPEWYSRMSSSIRDRASRPFFPSPHYHEGHA